MIELFSAIGSFLFWDGVGEMLIDIFKEWLRLK